MAWTAATAAANQALSRSSARAASQAAAVVSSALHEHVGGMVLDGLEGADGAAELLAHLGVFDGHVQRRPADPDRLGRGQDPEHRPAWRAAPRSTRSSATVTSRSATDPTLRVVSRESSAVTVTPSPRVDDDHVLTGGEHKHSASGAPSTAGSRRSPTRSEPIATLARQGRAPRPSLPSASPGSSCGTNGVRRAAVDHHRGGDRRQERAGRELAALGLQHHRQFGQAEARTAVLLGDRQPVPTEVGCPPTRCRPVGGPVRRAWRGLAARLSGG